MENEDERHLAERLFGTGEQALETGGLRRLLRTAGAGVRLGAGHIRARLGGGGPIDVETLEKLVASLGELKGIPMKMGQIMSYVDESLPPELRRVLALLQTQSVKVPFEQIEATIRAELGPRAELLLAALERRPVASASIGQVHRAMLPEGRFAVKVQYLDIDKALRGELGAASRAVSMIDRLAPGANIGAFVEEARERVLEECDYAGEAARQERFRTRFTGHPVLIVPAVLGGYSARRVLTTEWIEGEPFEGWLGSDPPQAERDRVGVALYEFYIGMLYREGLFNADPHPGNYLFCADGRVGMLDYGCVREFGPERVAALVRLRDAVRRDQPAVLRRALAEAGAADLGSGRAYDIARELLRAFYGPTLEDRVLLMEPTRGTRLGALIADKQNIMKLRLPADFLFLFRIKFGLHAVLARIGAAANWYRLEDSFERSVSPPWSPRLPRG